MQKNANNKSRINNTNVRLVIGVIPLIVFAILIGFLAIYNPFGNAIYNPPNLLSILNVVFVTGTGVIIAIISGLSYTKSGRLNILLLGCGVLAGGLASLIGGFAANISANYGVTTHNSGMLLASALQLASAIVTLLYISPNQPTKRKVTLLIGYTIIIIFFIALTWLTISNYTPLFFQQSGPTALRQTVLSLSIVFFSLSSFLFFLQYIRSRNTGLYWYSIALALFAIGMIAIVFQQKNADIFVWVGRAAQYAGGFYFIIAILSLRRKPERGIPLTERWVGIFSADRRQLSIFFSKLAEGFIYGRIITGNKGEPVDFVYLDANDSYERIREITKTQLIGQKATDIFRQFDEDPTSLIQKYGEVALSGKPTIFERYSTASDKWYHVSSYSPQSGYFIAILEDITERKKAEQALRTRTVELEETQKKLTQYATQMEKLAEERANQLKEAERMVAIGQTAGMVGHDIRNPLQAIVGELYLAKENIVDAPESKGKQDTIDSLNFIQEQIDYINKIVADLQDYARPTKPTITEIDFEEIIIGVFSVIAVPDFISLKIHVEPNLKTHSDANFLRRIITNLTTNAIQAMPSGGNLTIDARKIEDNVVITVQDTGHGIPDDVKDKLFKPLFTTKSKGQGFGLAVVKKFVEQLGGTITFESEEGKGTTFKIELPANN